MPFFAYDYFSRLRSVEMEVGQLPVLTTAQHRSNASALEEMAANDCWTVGILEMASAANARQQQWLKEEHNSAHLVVNAPVLQLLFKVTSTHVQMQQAPSEPVPS